MSSYTRQHLERLQRDGMDGRTALEIVGSVMYFARKNPQVLPDDIRFTLHLGYSICHALPLPQYPKVSWRTGQQYNVSRAAPRTPRREIGQFIRDRFGVFFKNVFDAIDREVTRKTEATLILAEPFITPDAR
jgi:hypothetical protein